MTRPPSKLTALFDVFKTAGVKTLHIDIMDGSYVPGFGFNDRFVNWIHKNFEFGQDVHLMVENPVRSAELFVKAGAERITMPADNMHDIMHSVEYIKSLGAEVGIGINPGEDPRNFSYVFPELNRILIMTSSPGYASHGIIPNMVCKVEWLSRFRKDHDLNYKIEVDGGVNADNIAQIAKFGCDEFVSGSYIVGAEHPSSNLLKLQELVSNNGEE